MNSQGHFTKTPGGITKKEPTPRWVKVTIALMLVVFVGVILGRDLIWAKYYVWKLRQAAAAKDAAGMRVAEGALTNYPNLFMVLGLYDDPDPQVRAAFVRMAVQMGKPLTGDLFILLWIDRDPEVRRAVIRATTHFPNYGNFAYFIDELNLDRFSFSLADKQLMIETMGRIPHPLAKEELLKAVSESTYRAAGIPAELMAAMVFALGDAYRDTNNVEALAALHQLKNVRGYETVIGWLPVEEEARAILMAQAPAHPEVSALVPLATQAAPTRRLGALIDRALERIRADMPTTLPEAIRAATQEVDGRR